METKIFEAETALTDILLCDEAKGLSREAALRRAAGTPGTWFVPKGLYTVSKPIQMCSNVTIVFENGAAICAAKEFSGRVVFYAGEFENICLCGGRFDAAGHIDELFLFENGTGLKLEKNTFSRYVKSAVTLRNLSGFEISGGMLLADQRSVDGFVLFGTENGVIQTIRGEGARNSGALVALYGKEAPIKKILVSDVAALNCASFVRIVSGSEPINDIQIRDLAGGCSNGAVIIEEYPDPTKKVGKNDPLQPAIIENVKVTQAELFSTERKRRGIDNALIRIKTPVNRFLLTGLSRPGLLDEFPYVETFRIDGQQKAPIAVSNIDFKQLDRMMHSGSIYIRVFSGKGFESEMHPGEQLVLPDGSVGYLSLRHILSDDERFAEELL